MDVLSYLGKFHPIVLHLPIGFLLLAFMMELHDRWKQTKTFQPAIGFALFWGMVGAIFAAVSGYLLSLDGGYENQLLNNHQWLGFGVAILSAIVFFIHQKSINGNNSLYLPLFSLLTLLLTVTGHLGGSLTHGSDFLSPNSTKKKAIVDIENAEIYRDLIQPILKDKCIRCHSASKTKGDLLMATIEGMKSGGKTGALFVAGDTEKSLMLNRIHLPIEEKEHMPPKGKQQLLADEVTLINWWIKEGANFKAKVKEVQKDDKITSILNKFMVPEDEVNDIKVAQLPATTLQKISKKGIPVYRVAKNSPFVEVDLSRKKGIDKNTLKALKPVAQQLISLNLAATDIQDSDLKQLTYFPHLQKLYLQQTNVSDQGIAEITKLDYLSYLNLYETKITDKSLPVLSKLKRLKKLYLWQTETTKAGIAQFVNQKPKTKVNSGIKEDIFGDARLKAPLIISEKDLFKDSLEVILKTNFKKVNLHYTLDGTTPDSTSQLYVEPILLNKTTNLKVIAQKEGWQTSEVASKQFANVKYTPVNIKLKQPPNDRYKGNGAESLIDLVKGSTTFTDGLWLGYEKQHLTVTMNLGKEVPISGVTVGALEAPGSYIFFPKGMKVSLSKDGKKYKEVITKTYPTTTENMPTQIVNFTENFATQPAQFIKIKVESNLVNPDWHPAPGAPCWLFIDEISVE